MEKLDQILKLVDELKTTVEGLKNQVADQQETINTQSIRILELENQVTDQQETLNTQNNLIRNYKIELQTSDFGNFATTVT
ncbi:hypothetical protein BpHYR1_011702 [Brachionus plicatilis]|uniref:Uncharacterized protein n=1 Tax=Brachionus plicatilis TaxID=10195 RepID=A0A3M7Q327_BRAPC|nr:hypothetical protein BpHYR1_011702 [Brachionus plicatilis]